MFFHSLVFCNENALQWAPYKNLRQPNKSKQNGLKKSKPFVCKTDSPFWLTQYITVLLNLGKITIDCYEMSCEKGNLSSHHLIFHVTMKPLLSLQSFPLQRNLAFKGEKLKKGKAIFRDFFQKNFIYQNYKYIGAFYRII